MAARRASRRKRWRSGACAARVGWEELDRDGAVEVDFAGEVDDAHAATAELAIDGVAAGECRLEREEERIDGIAGPGHV